MIHGSNFDGLMSEWSMAFFFLSVLLFSLTQANEEAGDNEPGDMILIEWEGEPGWEMLAKVHVSFLQP